MPSHTEMPAIKLFGRKWLAAADDLVYPGLFEIFIRTVWLILIGSVCVRYYQFIWSCRLGGELVRVYLLGQITFLIVSMILMLIIVKHSAKGSIMETRARKYVEPLLTVKILLILPGVAWNVLGSLWMFGDRVECSYDHYTVTVVQAVVLFDWVLIGLTIFGLALVFDPLGSLADKDLDTLAEHTKVSSNWIRRVKFLWWLRRHEKDDETLQHFADIMSALFRGTDIVPSDVMAGCILLMIRRKSQRLNLVISPQYTNDISALMADAPSWMSLKDALHYLKLSIASYGWMFSIYMHACTGYFRLLHNLTCCMCFRRKRTTIIGDNCCYCYLAGVKVLSDVSTDDILYASFKNQLCKAPFYVIEDHKCKAIVVIIRGSLSLSDLITDITADSAVFECEGLPPGSMAHRAMVTGAKLILKEFDENKILERAFATHPTYNLVITGHSLGAGLAILFGFLLRPRYPNLKVYAFSTPAGLLSREVARISEEFVLTIGVENDLVMRLGLHSAENFRTSMLMALRACRLPKYRVVLNGFGYMLFGIPEKDLSKTWTTNCAEVNTSIGGSPLLDERNNVATQENNIYERDFRKRRVTNVELYTGGKILHIVRLKPERKQTDRKSKKQGPKERKYGMRWAQPEDFRELYVEPRMLLDHFPNHVERALTSILEEQNNLPVYLNL
ncbi:diacylglycerol lipase-beta-like isoform X1 [Hylaeus volcanicus]|uniref:diacylglycerol lipase-beta-like isoform X1 n=2 Tax=Hylaeus volcanicus TaxID=313075 RepID=UPI0023B79830|nr:diacylglycerol lipase-beta-like isoform X1 [Hylaeus volcanicus]